MWLEFGLLLIGAYLFGSIPTAYLAVKWYRGVDIRLYGSGSVGASNVFRSFSRPLGIAVGLFDLGKGAFLVWIAELLGMGINLQIPIGLAVVIGHNWPVFLNFNAGRGLATTVGIVFYLLGEYNILPWGFAVFVFLAAFTFVVGGSPLPTLVAVAAMPLVSWGFQKPLALTLGLTSLFLLMVTRRLTAPKSIQAASVSTRERLINRFLFDRDIKDGKSWMKRRPAESVKNEKKKPDSGG